MTQVPPNDEVAKRIFLAEIRAVLDGDQFPALIDQQLDQLVKSVSEFAAHYVTYQIVQSELLAWRSGKYESLLHTDSYVKLNVEQFAQQLPTNTDLQSINTAWLEETGEKTKTLIAYVYDKYGLHDLDALEIDFSIVPNVNPDAVNLSGYEFLKNMDGLFENLSIATFIGTLISGYLGIGVVGVMLGGGIVILILGSIAFGVLWFVSAAAAERVLKIKEDLEKRYRNRNIPVKQRPKALTDAKLKDLLQQTKQKVLIDVQKHVTEKLTSPESRGQIIAMFRFAVDAAVHKAASEIKFT